jgi:phosphinothricin acetyltransferase
VISNGLEVLAPIRIRPAGGADADALAGIYNHYITHTVATFEEQALPGSEMAARVAAVQAMALPWLIAEQDGTVLGYAYATRWKQRASYRLSTETTVYLRSGCGGRGIGSALYEQLLQALRACGMHAAVGGIALPNEASVALHEKFGFEKVAQFRQIGFKLGRWVDVGYWQKIL